MLVHASLSLVQFFCEPMDCSLLGSLVHGITQARILEKVVISSSRGSSWTRDGTCISCTVGRFFTTKSLKWSEVTQSCPTLCDPMDCSLPGSSLHGILQTRVLEWVAISFSRGSSQPRDWTWVSCIPGRRFNIWATREACCHYMEPNVQTSILVSLIPIQQAISYTCGRQ